MILFPISLKLQERKCVVVGAGRIASAKAAELLRCGARVIVVSPDATATLRKKARAGAIVWRSRAFKPQDVTGAFLVVAATDSATINEAVFRACRARRVLCNVVDDPEHCDFFYTAVVQRGDLQIAISTGGQSPALASRLRKQLEKQFGKEWAPFVAQIGKLRRQILDSNVPKATKQKLLAQIVAS